MRDSEFMRGLKASLPFMLLFALALAASYWFEPRTSSGSADSAMDWLRKGAVFLSFVLCGAIVAPELSRREFRRPFLWQLGCSATAAVLIAFACSASLGGYGLALLLSARQRSCYPRS